MFLVAGVFLLEQWHVVWQRSMGVLSTPWVFPCRITVIEIEFGSRNFVIRSSFLCKITFVLRYPYIAILNQLPNLNPPRKTCNYSKTPFQDWTTIPQGRGISESQRNRLEKIKEAIGKFISAGLDVKYSTMDPIRLRLSFLKRSDEVPAIHKRFLAEIATLGDKPYSFF